MYSNATPRNTLATPPPTRMRSAAVVLLFPHNPPYTEPVTRQGSVYGRPLAYRNLNQMKNRLKPVKKARPSQLKARMPPPGCSSAGVWSEVMRRKFR